jgi:hypothetical protein
MYYLEGESKYLHILQLCDKNNYSCFDALMDQKEFDFIAGKNWSEILQDCGEEDLFGQTQEKKFKIVDITNLILNKNVIEMLKLSSIKDSIWAFYSSQTLLLEDKKKLISLGLEILNYKQVKSKEILDFCSRYTKYASLDLDFTSLEAISKVCGDFQEAIDMCDVVGELENTQKKNYLNSVTQEQTVPIFMQQFRISQLQTDIKHWIKILNKDNQQLITSLLIGKIEKQNHNKKYEVLQNLVNLDKSIKTTNSMSAVLQTKLFLWLTLQEIL